VPIDGQVKRALEGLEGTGFIWPDSPPRGGNASVAARLYLDEHQHSPAVAVDIDLFRRRRRWSELPVSVGSIVGTSRSSPIAQRGRRRFHLRGETRPARTVRIAGACRTIPRRACRSRAARAATSRPSTSSSARSRLRGADLDALAASLPDVGTQLESRRARQGRRALRGATLTTAARSTTASE